MNDLDFALHILYIASDNYPCEGCDFRYVCQNEKGSVCVVRHAFDVVHQEILRKEGKEDE